jgi:hypothetical protein
VLEPPQMSEPSEQKRRSLPEWMRRRLDDQQRFLVLCILCGFICGLVGVGFHLAIHGLFDMVWDLARSQSFWGFIAIMLGAPTLGGLAVGIVVQKWAPQCAGSGIPQTITIDPNCSIRDAANHLIARSYQQVPVVSQKTPDKMIGLLTLNDISRQQNASDGAI